MKCQLSYDMLGNCLIFLGNSSSISTCLLFWFKFATSSRTCASRYVWILGLACGPYFLNLYFYYLSDISQQWNLVLTIFMSCEKNFVYFYFLEILPYIIFMTLLLTIKRLNMFFVRLTSFLKFVR